MSYGLVSILFCLSMTESKGEVSVFLKTLRYFFRLFSYIWRYFDTAFRMQSLVYFVVIFMASLFAFFTMVAMIFIHSVRSAVVICECGMFVCWWFRILFRMGCACHSGSYCAMYMVFMMRWYVLRCLFHSLASLRDKKHHCYDVMFVRLDGGYAFTCFFNCFWNFVYNMVKCCTSFCPLIRA